MNIETTPSTTTEPHETTQTADLVPSPTEVRPADRSIRRPRTSRLRKLCLIALATLSLSAGATLVGSSPASAAQYWASGNVGYVNTGTGICRYYNAWNRLDAEVYAPDIYAPNHRAGGGNDWAAARYMVHVLNQSNQVVQSSGYSGWAWSWDNSPAIFSKVPTKFLNIPNNSTVVVQIEWSGGTTTSGVSLHRLDRYVLYSGGSGPYASPDRCSKWSL